jgi:dihydrofolate reductase
MYETMAVWDTIPADGPNEGFNQFADIWKTAHKIVYSTTLTELSAANTTIEHVFNAETVDELVTKSDNDFNIGGPHLAAAAIKAGIVDEYHQFIVPLTIGGGNHWLPKDIKRTFELMDLQKFENGTVHLRYRRV